MRIQRPLEQIKKYLLEHNETLAVAESVTAGNLQAALSLAVGATEFFQGGMTTYNVGQKTLQLQIDPIHGLACNCVSERIAQQMAENICTRFCSDWGIGIVGYAAPVKELNINIPFAYYAFSNKHRSDFIKKVELKRSSTIQSAQQYYVAKVLNDFASFIKDKGRS